MSNYDKKPNRVRVGGLWEGKGGVLSGNLGPLRIVAFREKEKKSERSPDFTLYFEEAPPKDKDAESRPSGSGAKHYERKAEDMLPPLDDDLNIPFA